MTSAWSVEGHGGSVWFVGLGVVCWPWFVNELIEHDVISHSREQGVGVLGVHVVQRPCVLVGELHDHGQHEAARQIPTGTCMRMSSRATALSPTLHTYIHTHACITYTYIRRIHIHGRYLRRDSRVQLCVHLDRRVIIVHLTIHTHNTPSSYTYPHTRTCRRLLLSCPGTCCDRTCA